MLRDFIGSSLEIHKNFQYLQLETASAEYAWLNGITSVAAGESHADTVIITAYEIT